MSKERLLISVPKRGIQIFPPAETAHKMSQARRGEVVTPFSLEEKVRLRELIHAKILERRYPTKQCGRAFMSDVDYEWGNQLLKLSQAFTTVLVYAWKEISNKPIAVILYGSISRGLVKRPDHSDPSNIDLAAIADFTDCEKEEFFDKIRPARETIRGYILSKTPAINPDSKGGNVGIHLNTIRSLEVSNYSSTINYLQAAAVPLYDPDRIWERLEGEAIRRAMPKRWRICSIPHTDFKNGKNTLKP